MARRAPQVLLFTVAGIALLGGLYLAMRTGGGEGPPPDTRPPSQHVADDPVVERKPPLPDGRNSPAAKQVQDRLRSAGGQIVAQPKRELDLDAISARPDAGTAPQGAAPSPGDPYAAPRRYTLQADGIRSAVQDSLPEIRDCYEEWLKVNPSIEGRLKVQFTVKTDEQNPADGKVTGVSLGDERLGHLPMEGCVLSVFEDLKFEAPRGGELKVTYPIALTPGETDAG